MLKTLNLDKQGLDSFVPKGTAIPDTEPLKEDYLKHFRCRKANLKLDNDKDMYKEICKIYRDLFDITKSKRKKFSPENNIMIAEVDKVALEYHEQIFTHRQNIQKKPLTKKLFKSNKKPILDSE